MKFKSITMILTILLFTCGISEFMMIFMKFKIPATMITISTILLVIGSTYEFMSTRKLRKLSYPLIIIYFLVGIPIIEKFINNLVLFICFVVLSFILTMVFLYSELKIINKEKNSPN